MTARSEVDVLETVRVSIHEVNGAVQYSLGRLVPGRPRARLAVSRRTYIRPTWVPAGARSGLFCRFVDADEDVRVGRYVRLDARGGYFEPLERKPWEVPA